MGNVCTCTPPTFCPPAISHWLRDSLGLHLPAHYFNVYTRTYSYRTVSYGVIHTYISCWLPPCSRSGALFSSTDFLSFDPRKRMFKFNVLQSPSVKTDVQWKSPEHLHFWIFSSSCFWESLPEATQPTPSQPYPTPPPLPRSWPHPRSFSYKNICILNHCAPHFLEKPSCIMVPPQTSKNRHWPKVSCSQPFIRHGFWARLRGAPKNSKENAWFNKNISLHVQIPSFYMGFWPIQGWMVCDTLQKIKGKNLF